MKVLLLGGTDLSQRIAEVVMNSPATLCGVVGIGQTFSISYNKGGVANNRFADMKEWASANSVPHIDTTDTGEILSFATRYEADFCVVAGWYHMVPARLRDAFPRGTLGIHASLLPKLRGGAPLNWAILSGLTETGVSLFELGDGVDDGALYGQGILPINSETTICELVSASHAVAASLLAEAIPEIMDGASPAAQVGVPTYCLQRSPEDGVVDWSKSASDIQRLVRAVGRPYSGATSSIDGQNLTIWSARDRTGDVEILGAYGQIACIPGLGPLVVTGRGVLEIVEAELDGVDAIPVLRKSGNKRLRSN